MLIACVVTSWLLSFSLVVLLFSNRRPALLRRIRLLRLEVAHQVSLVKRARRERDAALAAVELIADGCDVPQRIAVEALGREEEEVSCEAN